jgi:hypothetical protein
VFRHGDLFEKIGRQRIEALTCARSQPPQTIIDRAKQRIGAEDDLGVLARLV